MKLQKLSPWNWFRSEHVDAPVEGESRRGDLTPVSGMHQELDRWMDNMFRQFGMPSVESRLAEMPSLLRPRLDIREQPERYEISVEVPGVEEKDVKLTLDDNRLVIEGEKRQESKSEEGEYHRVERSYGSFRRVLDLPADARVDEIEASFAKGVLTVSVPRSGEAASRRREIPIHS